MAGQQVSYTHLGGYDESVFLREFQARFARGGRYNAAALPALSGLVRMVGADVGITDVRWAAYILATVYWETTVPTKVTRTVLNKKGQPLLNKSGQAVTVTERPWLMSMAPVNEIGAGKGRRYHEPVKVKKLADGSARVTEQDGDQFSVQASGRWLPLTKKATLGTVDGGPASAVYDADDGQELAYFGRGYVQLTWWSNYAAAGVALGRGLDLLLDPELVKDPAIAYALMSHGMRTGEGFANGHRLGQYFFGSHSDYVGARRMVNGQDHAANIAAIARDFEASLMAARIGVPILGPMGLQPLPAP
jgi:Chitinase class I